MDNDNRNLETIIEWALSHGLSTGHADSLPELLDEIGAQIDQMNQQILCIRQWADAYPVDIFPEPDFEKVKKGLASVDIKLDAVSASIMRSVIYGVKDILNP